MRKKKLYVVGYDNDLKYIYGKHGFLSPATAYDAKRIRKQLPVRDAVIYKFVKIDLNKI